MIKYNIDNIITKKMNKQGVKLMKKGEINAVHDDDLVELLKSLKVYDDVINEKVKCAFCGRKITLQNISSVFPMNNEVKFCCNDKKCYELIMKGCDLGE